MMVLQTGASGAPEVSIRPANLSLLLLVSTLTVACSSGPQRELTLGEALLEQDFSAPNSFEEGAYSDATLRIEDGRYLIKVDSGDSEVWWGQWGAAHGNVAIDVDVEQLSEREETAWGVACRLRGQVGRQQEPDPLLRALVTGDTALGNAAADMAVEAPAAAIANGDGYLFLIQGGGSWGIFRARSRDLFPLRDWEASELIQRGPGGRNHLRAVCVDDYLALYINGQFVAGVEDKSFASGQVGLAASAFSRLGAEISFDNLVVREAGVSAAGGDGFRDFLDNLVAPT